MSEHISPFFTIMELDTGNFYQEKIFIWLIVLEAGSPNSMALDLKEAPLLYHTMVDVIMAEACAIGRDHM